MTRSSVRRYAWLMICAAGLWPPTRAIAQDTQNRPVTGSVTQSANGQPIAAATVLITGTQRGTQTDNEGHFRIMLPATETPLTVRAIGFLPKSVTVGPSDNTVAVSLLADPAKLELVVVTGQATGIAKRLAPTSTADVGNAPLNRAPAATVDLALQGKVPGANIQTNSGAPGGGVQVQIRGVNTAIGAADPLFVVDGVIYSNTSVSTGLFTATASGSINANNNPGNLQDDPINRLGDLNPTDIESIEVMKSAAAASIYGSKAANGVVIITTKRGQAGKPRITASQGLGFSELLRGPATRQFTVPTALAAYPHDTALITGIAAANGGKLPFYDHLQEVAGQKPLLFNTTADVSGGTQSTRYYIGGTWNNEGGIINNSGAARQSLRGNLDQHLGKGFEGSFSTNFVHNDANRGFVNNDNTGASVPYAIAYIPGFINMQPAKGIFPVLPITYAGSNPLQVIVDGTNNVKVNRFTGSGRLTYQAFTTDNNSLQLVGAGGFDYFDQHSLIFVPFENYGQQTTNPPGLQGVSTPGNANNRNYNFNLNAIETFSPSAFKATSSVGLTWEDRQLFQSHVTAQGLLPGQQNINQASTLNQPFQDLSLERTFSAYGAEQITALNERAVLEFGLRAEKSSANGDVKKFFVYPKVAAAYRFPGILGSGSELKLRAAYGETGNQPLFGQKFTLFTTEVIGGAPGVGISGNTIAGSPTITPERTREAELGLDASAWDGRADLQVTIYRRRTSNLFLPRTPAPSTGFAETISNGGTFQNRGIEIGAGVTPIQGRSFQWNFRTSFSSIDDRVAFLPFPFFRPATAGYGLAFGEFKVQQGFPITAIFGQILDKSGNPIVVYLGKTNPEYMVSFTNEFNFHQFQLSTLLDWQKGGLAENQTKSLYDCNNLAADDGTAAGHARVVACGSDARPFVESTTFVKLREVRLSYNMPEQFARMFAGASTVQFSVSGRNLLVSTKYFGYDPESSNFGQAAITRNVDLAPYPPSRKFYFTVTAGF